MVSAANGLVSRNTARAGGSADRLDTVRTGDDLAAVLAHDGGEHVADLL